MRQIRIALLFLVLSFCAMSSSADSPAPPNIVILLADDLGYNDLSVYRNSTAGRNVQKPPTSQTPNIDKLAGDGMRFTDFYCGAGVCSPSRAALMTGRNATRVGIYNWIPKESPMHLRAGEITIAEILKRKNYRTGHFGKWHLTSEGTDQPIPNDQGFDYSFWVHNNALPSHRDPVNYIRNRKPVGNLKGYACDLVVDEAIAWLDENSASPFYINVWFNEPHLKVAAPPELAGRHQYNQEYYGCIENMDQAVGRLLAYLKKNGLYDNTIVMFSSDNGSRWDNSNKPLRGEKCFNYEGGVRVPFIARWPGRIPAGSIHSAPGSFTDILPTVAAFTGAAVPSDRVIDGNDLSSVFMGKRDAVKRKRPIFFYRYFHDPICMLRDGDWCLLGYDIPQKKAERLNESALGKIKPWHFTPQHMNYLQTLIPRHFELYNLRDDVGQNRDLSGEYPERVNDMKKMMLRLRSEMIREGGDWYAPGE